VCRRGRLGHALRTGPAGIFGPDRDDHPELRRYAVEPFGAVLADLHHLPAPARTLEAVWLDHAFDALKVVRQAADIALGRLTRNAPVRASFAFGLGLCNCRLEIFKQQVELVRIEPLRLLAIKRAAQFLHEMLKPLVQGFKFPDLLPDGSSVLFGGSGLFFSCSSLLFGRGSLVFTRRNQPCLRCQNRPHPGRKFGKFSSSERLGHEAYYTLLRPP